MHNVAQETSMKYRGLSKTGSRTRQPKLIEAVLESSRLHVKCSEGSRTPDYGTLCPALLLMSP